MGRRSNDLTIVGVVTALGLGLTLIDLPLPLLRLLFGLPLVLICPGYALTAALFLDRPPAFAPALRDRDYAGGFPVWLLFSLGLSLGMTILAGFLLNLTAWGLQPASWALMLSALTGGAIVAAVLRRRHYPAPALAPAPTRRLKLDGRTWGLFGLAVLIGVAAFGIAQAGARDVPEAAFTQLWIRPGDAAGPSTVRVGFSNQERTVLQYRLVVEMGARRVGEWSSLTLEPSAQWETTVALPANEPPTATVYVRLYRADRPDSVYRQVTLRRDP